MVNRTIVSGITLLALILASPGYSSDSNELNQVLARAEASLAEARADRNAWTTTERLISDARANSDPVAALELAQRALLTAQAAKQQAQQEQDAWQARVPTQ